MPFGRLRFGARHRGKRVVKPFARPGPEEALVRARAQDLRPAHVLVTGGAGFHRLPHRGTAAPRAGAPRCARLRRGVHQGALPSVPRSIQDPHHPCCQYHRDAERPAGGARRRWSPGRMRLILVRLGVQTRCSPRPRTCQVRHSRPLFNVACGERITLNGVLSVLGEISGAALEPDHQPGRPGEVRPSQASIERARAVSSDARLRFPSRRGSGGRSSIRSRRREGTRHRL